jgi:hypothetical protein
LRSVPPCGSLSSAGRRWPSPFLQPQQEQNFDGILTQSHDAFRRFGECLLRQFSIVRGYVVARAELTDATARPNAQMTFFMKRYFIKIIIDANETHY